ncbi:MAG TPA: hypothetical protein VIJ14_00325, partial [Rhabdochlamydiaceae bacterium]
MDTRKKVLSDDDIKRALVSVREHDSLISITAMFEKIKDPAYDYDRCVSQIIFVYEDHADSETCAIILALSTLNDPALNQSPEKHADLEAAKGFLESVVRQKDVVKNFVVVFALRTLGEMYEEEQIEDIYGLPGIVKAIDLYTQAQDLNNLVVQSQDLVAKARNSGAIKRAKAQNILGNEEVIIKLNHSLTEVASNDNYNEFDKLCAWA